MDEKSRKRESMKTKYVAIVISIGCALLTGCVQMQLQSGDEQTRIAALDQLTDDDLGRVIFGYPLRDAVSFLYQQRGYSDDVKIAAINKLWEKGCYSRLASLCFGCTGYRDEWRIQVGDIKVEAIKMKFATLDGYELLCSIADRRDRAAIKLLGKMSGDDFFVWVAHNEKREGIVSAFNRPWKRRRPVGSGVTYIRSTVGEHAVSQIKGTGALAKVAQDRSCQVFPTRFYAAEKAFGNGDISGDDIRAIMASFDGCNEYSEVLNIAGMAINAAKRIGATDVVQELESKYYANIKQQMDEEEAAKRKAAARRDFKRNLGMLHQFFVPGQDRNAKEGNVFWNSGANNTYFLNGDELGLATAESIKLGRDCNCKAVVKQVVNGGVIVGCVEEIQRVGYYFLVDDETKYTTYRFPNKIFVKTDELFAEGDLFDVEFLKYVGITMLTDVNGARVTLHTFEPCQVPDAIK